MTDESTELLPGALDAAEYVLYHIDQLRDAKTLGEQADAFVALQNAAADLKSFHPEFDANSGTMPWDREDDIPKPLSVDSRLTILTERLFNTERAAAAAQTTANSALVSASAAQAAADAVRGASND